MRNLASEGRMIILKTSIVLKIIHLAIEELRKISSSESRFLSKIYMYTLYNHFQNRDLKIVAIHVKQLISTVLR